MNAPHTQQHAPEQDHLTAEEAANALLRNSFTTITRVAPAREIGMAEAILVGIHAITTQQAAILSELKRIAGR